MNIGLRHPLLKWNTNCTWVSKCTIVASAGSSYTIMRLKLYIVQWYYAEIWFPCVIAIWLYQLCWSNQWINFWGFEWIICSSCRGVHIKIRYFTVILLYHAFLNEINIRENYLHNIEKVLVVVSCLLPVNF